VALRQDIPLPWAKIEGRGIHLVGRDQDRDPPSVGHLRLEPRPLVDPASALHQQRVDPDPDLQPPTRPGALTLLEAEGALVPTHQVVDRLLELEDELPPELRLRDAPHLHEDLTEGLRRRLTLELEPALQLAFGQLPGAQELLTQPPERPPLLHTHYLTLIEVDLRLVVADLRPHSQDPRLPGQIQ